MTPVNLSNLPIAVKALFTGYILSVGIALLIAGMQIMLTHGISDGNIGLSVDDVVYSYYGNRSNSKLENKLNGSMQDKATTEEKNKIVYWIKKGANKETWQKTIHPIIVAKCASCHANTPTLSNITKYTIIKELAKIDEGIDISSLTRISHIHLFGISFIFFFVGLIFSLATGFNQWIKLLLIVTPFAFLLLDVSAWWLTRLNPGFAWLVIIGGIGYSFASAIMLFSSIYQMWVMPFLKHNSNENAWNLTNQPLKN